MPKANRAQIDNRGFFPAIDRGRFILFEKRGRRILWDSETEIVYQLELTNTSPENLYMMIIDLALSIKSLLQNPSTQEKIKINQSMNEILRDLIETSA
jgi:hypothetical protein